MKIIIFTLFLSAVSLSTNAQITNKISNNSDTINLKERLWGLTFFWYQIKTDFAYYGRLSFDWDSTYKNAISEVINTSERFQYYQILRKLCAKLKDGHTNVYLPADLRAMYLAYPPLRLKKVENRVFIQTILNDSLKTAGLNISDEILSINKMPLAEYTRKYISPFVCASTPQDSLNRVYTNELLLGARDSTLLLETRTVKGEIKNIVITRKMIPVKPPYQPVEYEILKREHVGILTVNTFDNDSLPQWFEKIMPQFVECKGLIIDLRRNGGGNSDNAEALLPYFFANGYYEEQGHTRMHISDWKSFGYTGADGWTGAKNDSLWIQSDTSGMKFLKPIVLLTSEKTFSAAEDFVSTMKDNKRAITIGEATAGSTGQNVFYQLPGGGSFRLVIKKSTFLNGKEFVGTGISSDIKVKQTVEDFLNNKDVVLQQAINYLQGK